MNFAFTGYESERNQEDAKICEMWQRKLYPEHPGFKNESGRDISTGNETDSGIGQNESTVKQGTVGRSCGRDQA